jgi:hypothetical protein
MKESTLLETSGISFSIINPHNGTTLVLELPPGQRSTWLILRGPLGEKTFHVKVDDNPEAGDLDLVVEMFTNASRRAVKILTMRATGKSTRLAREEVLSEIETEEKPEEKVEPKPEPKPEEKVEEKPEEKVESKPEEKVESKAPTKAPGTKPGRPGTRA